MPRSFIVFLILLFPVIQLFSQVKLIPSCPTSDDTVTVIFDASKGNTDLDGFSGTVYAHTGVITAASAGPWDWKNVVGAWGTADPMVEMTDLGGGLHRIDIPITSFYGLLPSDEVHYLAFVFRNADGSIVGRGIDGEDILVPINKTTYGDYVSHTFADGRMEMTTSNGKLLVEILGGLADLYRVEFFPGGTILPDTSPLVDSIPANGGFFYAVDDQPGHISVNWGQGIQYVIEKSPVRIRWENTTTGDTIFAEEAGAYYHPDGAGARFMLESDEMIYGTGSRAIDINRNGRRLMMYNRAQYSYASGAHTVNLNVPFLLSSKGYGLFLNNYGDADIDIGHSDAGILAYHSTSGRFSYYLSVSRDLDHDAILNSYTALTGRQEMPPLWSLGYIQSKFGYENESEARTIVNQLQTAGFPLDAIALDLYWFGDFGDMGNMDWDNTRFPDPVGMMDDFDSLGVKTILISEPYILTTSVNYGTTSSMGILGTDGGGSPYVVGSFWAGPAGLLDIYQDAAKDWFWDLYKARTLEGVGGWWCDLGEPENHPWEMQHTGGSARDLHNLYANEWAQGLYEGYATDFPNQRLVNIGRSGWAGGQRFGIMPWSGDVNRSWSGLQAQVPMTISAGLSGYGYMHSDLGGFTGGPMDDELYTRWLQLGAFSPVMRAHGEGVPPEPTAYSSTVQDNVRDAIELRYSLLPYTYTLAYENAKNGLPLVRPVDYYAPGTTFLQDINDEFLWGRDLLIAPVLEASVVSRPVKVPGGTWIDFYSDLATAGPGVALGAAPLSRIPVFVRRGAFIPMIDQIMTTAEYSTDSLIIRYYPNADSTDLGSEIFIDDGITPGNLESGNYELIAFEGHNIGDQTEIIVRREVDGWAGRPIDRELHFEIHLWDSRPDLVEVDFGSFKEDLPIVTDLASFQGQDSAAFWDSTESILHVHYNMDEGATDDEHSLIINGAVGMAAPLESVNGFFLSKPHPNPHSGQFGIYAEIVRPGRYDVELLDIHGRLVKTIYSGGLGIGRMDWEISGESLEKGIYLVRMSNEYKSIYKKVIRL